MGYSCRYTVNVEPRNLTDRFLSLLAEASEHFKAGGRRRDDGSYDNTFTWYDMDESVAEAMRSTGSAMGVLVHQVPDEPGAPPTDYDFQISSKPGDHVRVQQFDYVHQRPQFPSREFAL